MDPSSGPSSGAPRPESGDANALTEPLAEPLAEPAVTSLAGATSTAHLARFEFSDAGTKILMVEWVPDAVGAAGAAVATAAAAATTTRGEAAASPIQVPSKPAADSAQTTTTSAPSKGVSATSDPNSGPGSGPGSGRLGTLTGAEAAPWEVSWPGKSTFLPARDADLDVSATGSSEAAEERRRVFFLLPPDAPVPAKVTITPPGRTSIEVKPLPAIFPQGFQDEVDFPGSRGVLHTIWAKKRVRELEREMDAEMRANAESVGLEMAMAEKQWILDNFLRPPQPSPLNTSLGSPEAMTPISPRSPITGRLGEKLKGLKLATSAADLAPSPTANTFTSAGSQSQTLSPKGSDIAVSSFSSVPNGAGAQVTGAGPMPVSLNAVMKGETPAGAPITDDDELFALPISPRSPDMKKSPFSTLRG